MLPWLVVLGLIAANALYVLAEFAAVGARRSRIQQLAEAGDRRARLLLPVVTDPRELDRYIAACQVGITLSSLVLGAYAQVAVAGQLAGLLEAWGALGAVAAQSAAIVIVLMGLTALQVVLGELVPKSLALQYPVRAALATVVPMRWSLRLFSWFIAVLNGSGLALLRLLGVPPGHRHVHSPEEIDLLIAESARQGVLEAEDQRRLRRALRLGARTASQLMVPRRRIAAVDADRPLEALLRQLADSPYTRLPAYRGSLDEVIGMVHVRHVTLQHLEAGRLESIDALVRPMLSVPEHVDVIRLLALMREHGTKIALVVDEFGGTSGLITVEDILEDLLESPGARPRPGEIGPERLPDGRVRLPGTMRLHEAEPWLGVLWKGDAETVGGRVTEALGRLAVRGDHVVIDGVEVQVERVERRAVAAVLVRPVSPGAEDQA